MNAQQEVDLITTINPMLSFAKPGLSIIGAPTGVGTHAVGNELAPQTLRQAGLCAVLKDAGWAVKDCGDVSGPFKGDTLPVRGYRNLPEVIAWNQAVHDAVHAELSVGSFPLLLGGDHSMAVGSISAVARHCRAAAKPLHVIWLDAHADYNTVHTSPTGNLHGMPLAFLCGEGPPELTHMAGFCPAVPVENIQQIGVRSIDPLELVRVGQTHLHVFTMAQIEAMGMGAVVQAVLAGIPNDAHVHLSFDVDCLDPELAPGVGTPVADGPDFHIVKQCLQSIAQSGLLGSMDLVELNPVQDRNAKTTGLVLELMVALFTEHGLVSKRRVVEALHRVDEVTHVKGLMHELQSHHLPWGDIAERAEKHARRMRADRQNRSGVGGLMLEYSLSSEEGVALMCLAEALLRIPDAATRDELIREKIGHGNWQAHLGHSPSIFVNAATWGLLIAGRWCAAPSDEQLMAASRRLVAKGGQTLIRRAAELAVSLMGSQFVVAETIDAAVEKSRAMAERGHTFSFDMLGEAALSQSHAQAYFESYSNAIARIAELHTRDVDTGDGISVKLSALHPRYSMLQADRVHAELYPRLYALALQASECNMGLNIDAEESDRLMLSLELIQRLAQEPDLKNWSGLGVVVQAYQTRAVAVVNYLAALARVRKRRIMVRLVKGAYWDTEIKTSQAQGLSPFPVFTRKVHTDISYLVCAQRLLAHAEVLYPQFATHNAHTFATVVQMARQCGVSNYEMQCLYGMGEGLYTPLLENGELQRCRVYAPVGAHISLLPYLVRRLLEIGANSSFVNRLIDPGVSIETLVQSPFAQLQAEGLASNPMCTPATHLFMPERMNSLGLDLQSRPVSAAVMQSIQGHKKQLSLEPPQLTGAHEVSQAFARARQGQFIWRNTSSHLRAACLRQFAVLLHTHQQELLSLLVHEARKTLPNGVAEIREAVDFCRYYAHQLELLQAPAASGVAVCISPWNFPLAIFTGQVVAALAAGYCVLAKPSELTPCIAQFAVRLLHQAGVPDHAIQCLPGDGVTGALLTASPHVAAVLFTGSCATAKHIQRSLLQHGPARGLPLLIAETGGQNAMVVDSSAHLDQVVHDVIESAFDSAGQRCSALRVLCVQEEVATLLVNALLGAMQSLRLGDPGLLKTDIGPLIDSHAKSRVDAHIGRMRSLGLPVHQAGELEPGTGSDFVLPTVIEIDRLDQLQHEVFGPVLHVLRFSQPDLPALMEQINESGFALTFGIHSRIESFTAQLAGLSRAGNVYVNRNMVGAVVGSQPFGGSGLSGTGPKAGGPLYLQKLMRIAHPRVSMDACLPGPTGEQNQYRLVPRGLLLCTATDHSALGLQIQACIETGNTPLVLADAEGHRARWLEQLPPELSACIRLCDALDHGSMDGVLCEDDPVLVHEIHCMLATHCQAILPVIQADAQGEYATVDFYREQVVSTNTAALGGNAALMAK